VNLSLNHRHIIVPGFCNRAVKDTRNVCHGVRNRSAEGKLVGAGIRCNSRQRYLPERERISRNGVRDNRDLAQAGNRRRKRLARQARQRAISSHINNVLARACGGCFGNCDIVPGSRDARAVRQICHASRNLHGHIRRGLRGYSQPGSNAIASIFVRLGLNSG